MAMVMQSVRFGTVELADEALVEFPLGLIGLPGSGYAFLDLHPESGIRWLHSTEDPALALPVIDPRVALPGFELAVGVEERERIGTQDLDRTEVYVTVRASPDPAQSTVNARANRRRVRCSTPGIRAPARRPAARAR
jgi:flagellar assembly factor FliW